MAVVLAGILGALGGVMLGAWLYHRARLGSSPFPTISFKAKAEEKPKAIPVLISRP